MSRFVLATANPDKAREIAKILGDDIALAPRPEHLGEVEESGETLEANARLKARSVAAATGMAAIADDTGLEVEALAGKPGVRSARFAGEHATYADNVRKLLHELKGVPEPRRARFRTVALAAWPDGKEVMAEGIVTGRIATTPKGAAGFGYDPVFVPDSDGERTFAEMAPDEKHFLSHRGMAFRSLADLLRPQLRVEDPEPLL